MRPALLLLPLLAACSAAPPPEAPPPPNDSDLPFVRPYRAEGDACMLVGESPVTVEYLDHTADLVACPINYEGLGVFVTETGGQLMASHAGYHLFSVPRG